jgi:hypothetical protein
VEGQAGRRKTWPCKHRDKERRSKRERLVRRLEPPEAIADGPTQKPPANQGRDCQIQAMYDSRDTDHCLGRAMSRAVFLRRLPFRDTAASIGPPRPGFARATDEYPGSPV